MPGTFALGLLSALSLWANYAPGSVRNALSFFEPVPAVEVVTRARIPAGSYRPLYAANPQLVEMDVAAFELDVVPVTNRRFRQFVLHHLEWRRDRASSLFVDLGYLGHWAGPNEPAPGTENRPVTGVSWF